MDWSHVVDYCSVLITNLDSHSDVTPRIHWWASNVNFSFDKETHWSTSWVAWRWVNQLILIFGWSISLIMRLYDIAVNLSNCRSKRLSLQQRRAIDLSLRSSLAIRSKKLKADLPWGLHHGFLVSHLDPHQDLTSKKWILNISVALSFLVLKSSIQHCKAIR